MRHSSIVAAAILTLALVGCAEDGPDAPGAAFAAADDGSAAAVHVVARTTEDGHDDATHDDATHDDTTHDDTGEAMENDGEMAHDDAATHDGGETTHDDGDADHDETAATHDDGEATHHDAEATHDDGEATHDDGEATHDQGDAGHDDAAANHDGSNADHDETAGAEPDGFVVDVEMVEFGFILDATEVPMGEPVTFRFRNTGVIEHEAMFGSAHQQTEYAAADGHGDGHGDDSHHGDIAAITLAAGETGEMVLSFSEPDEIWIGCHLEGHWDAGMQTTFKVA